MNPKKDMGHVRCFGRVKYPVPLVTPFILVMVSAHSVILQLKKKGHDCGYIH